MKLLKYFLFILILICSLYFLVELNNINSINNEPIKIKIPYLSVNNPEYHDGFNVWIVILSALSAGVLVGFLLALFQIISQKSDLIKTRSKLKKLQIELDSLRNQAIDNDIEIIDKLDESEELPV